MKLLVCGNRDYPDYHAIAKVLDGLHRSRPISQLIEGGALGADRFARYWANKNDIPVRTFDAQWQLYGRSAGPMRNRQMLIENKPDQVIAFLNKSLKRSIGTANLIMQARRYQIPVSIIEDIGE